MPKELRESLNLSRKVLIINAGDHLKMIPLPLDPLKVLHGVFNIEKSFKELRKKLNPSLKKRLKLMSGGDFDAPH